MVILVVEVTPRASSELTVEHENVYVIVFLKSIAGLVSAVTGRVRS